MPWTKIAEESVSGCSWASQMRLMAPFDQPMAFTFSSFRCARSAWKSARTAARPRSDSSRTGPEPPMPRGSKYTRVSFSSSGRYIARRASSESPQEFVRAISTGPWPWTS